ncbi:MAG: chorismate synthase, partial [Acutalibacter sp.]|nr:chorismate synthase [Acutalibacter sp.]
MSSSWGDKLRISIFGGSHTQAIGVNIEGLPAGETIVWEDLLVQMARRAPGQDRTAN